VRSANMTRIAAIRSALPQYRYRQAELTGAMAELSNVGPPQRALLERLHANAGVDTRHTVLPLAEYKGLDGFGPTNDLYIEHATALGERALDSALRAAGVAARDLDLLIVTSVTGLAVPSLDARLIPRLGLRSDIKRVPIFGLGCVAGAAGLARLHDYLLGWPGHTAALLAVELCSLTVPAAGATTPDLVVSGLFGDGAVAVVARGEQAGGAGPGAGAASGSAVGAAAAGARASAGGPRVIASRSEVYPDTGDVLAWRLGSAGFRIVLTAELASVVGRHLRQDVSAFLAASGLTIGDITSWVCHPGGPKVIDAVEQGLGLPADALEVTRRSLAEVGNMSSASVLHVLQQTIDTARPPPGSPGMLIGLGPGVSVELILLQW
jgi:alkylresorcinol/alkylpyrone synthase